ncbi:MAG: hypothetical protein CMN32_07750 [Saprospirales bacterium]|nr:hypothetical protein [Saprospirales bacterium]
MYMIRTFSSCSGAYWFEKLSQHFGAFIIGIKRVALFLVNYARHKWTYILKKIALFLKNSDRDPVFEEK